MATAAASIARRSARSWLARVPVLIVVVAGLSVMFPILPDVVADPLRAIVLKLEGPLVRGIAQSDIPDDADIAGIVVLGGQFPRFAAAAKLAQQFPKARLLASGAGPDEIAVLLRRGVDSSRIVSDPAANTTLENATRSKSLLAPRPGERWLLVTSSIHMRRASGAFCAAGFEIEPYPVFDLHRVPRYDAPVVVREAMALVVYNLLGRVCGPASNVR